MQLHHLRYSVYKAHGHVAHGGHAAAQPCALGLTPPPRTFIHPPLQYLISSAPYELTADEVCELAPQPKRVQ